MAVDDKVIEIDGNKKLDIFSDTHGNLKGLDLLPEGNEFVRIYLGDIFDKSAETAQKMIDYLVEIEAICSLGDHDEALIDDSKINRWREKAEMLRENNRCKNADLLEKFCNEALTVRRGMKKEYLDFVDKLPKQLTLNYNGKIIKITHSALSKIFVKDSYMKDRIVTKGSAAANFERNEFDILLVGHSHTPIMYKTENKNGGVGLIEETIFFNDQTKDISEGRYIISVGSLGDGEWSLRGYPKYNLATKPFDSDYRETYGVIQSKPNKGLIFSMVFSKYDSSRDYEVE